MYNYVHAISALRHLTHCGFVAVSRTHTTLMCFHRASVDAASCVLLDGMRVVDVLVDVDVREPALCQMS